MSHHRDWADALLSPDARVPPDLSSWNGSDPGRRFAVYRNNVRVSLVEALADTFPVVRALVGEAFFDAMALEFATAAPPASPVLAHYGQGFPAFVAGFAPAAGLPYLAEVARLELAYVAAFHAPDAAPLPLAPIQAALADPGGLAGLRVGLHPSLQVVRSPYAIVSLWAAHQGQGQLETLDPARPENAWLLRPGLQVQVLSMGDGDCALVAALADGRPLGEAVLAAQAAADDFDLSRCLAVLLREQAIIQLH